MPKFKSGSGREHIVSISIELSGEISYQSMLMNVKYLDNPLSEKSVWIFFLFYYSAACNNKMLGGMLDRLHSFFIRTFFIRTLRLRNAQKLRTCQEHPEAEKEH